LLPPPPPFRRRNRARAKAGAQLHRPMLNVGKVGRLTGAWLTNITCQLAVDRSTPSPRLLD